MIEVQQHNDKLHKEHSCASHLYCPGPGTSCAAVTNCEAMYLRSSFSRLLVPNTVRPEACEHNGVTQRNRDAAGMSVCQAAAAGEGSGSCSGECNKGSCSGSDSGTCMNLLQCLCTALSELYASNRHGQAQTVHQHAVAAKKRS